MEPGKKKLLIWSIVIAIVLVVAYFIFKKKKVKTEALASSINVDAFPLKEGSQGTEVMRLQKYILDQFPNVVTKDGSKVLSKFGADGLWGPETTDAVEAALKRSSVSLDYFTRASLGSIAV